MPALKLALLGWAWGVVHIGVLDGWRAHRLYVEGDAKPDGSGGQLAGVVLTILWPLWLPWFLLGLVGRLAFLIVSGRAS
jgi:hypothetical protein